MLESILTAFSISIHALREEGDLIFGRGQNKTNTISIHALREEGDLHTASLRPPQSDFYPRPPRGGRPPASGRWRRERGYFYPRPPRGGRRQHQDDGDGSGDISIHALREEGDMDTLARTVPSANFYPRPPRGGRRGGFFVYLMVL